MILWLTTVNEDAQAYPPQVMLPSGAWQQLFAEEYIRVKGNEL